MLLGMSCCLVLQYALHFAVILSHRTDFYGKLFFKIYFNKFKYEVIFVKYYEAKIVNYNPVVLHTVTLVVKAVQD